MAKHEVYSVRDAAVGAFLLPIYARARGEALRLFMTACNDAKHDFHAHASDYVLFHIGHFDDVSGLMEPIEPARVLSALEAQGVAPV